MLTGDQGRLSTQSRNPRQPKADAWRSPKRSFNPSGQRSTVRHAISSSSRLVRSCLDVETFPLCLAEQRSAFSDEEPPQDLCGAGESGTRICTVLEDDGRLRSYLRRAFGA